VKAGPDTMRRTAVKKIFSDFSFLLYFRQQM
jgi:hypothetical protein